MKASSLKESTPRFILEEYFLGPLHAQGMFFDRFGTLRRSLTLDLEGSEKGGHFELAETLTYDNGVTEQRVYHITRIDEHHYRATAPGLVGPAEIESYGNCLHWRYKLLQTIGTRQFVLSFDDWMYLHADGLMLNHARAFKWGVRIGELLMAVQKGPKR